MGPMFSGKTSTIIKKSKNKQNSIVIKPDIDTRNGNTTLVSSHDGLIVNAISAYSLCDIWNTLSIYDNIFIDEGQFFPDLYDFVERYHSSYSRGILKKKIYVSGLDYDFRCKEFPQIAAIIPLCSKIIKRSSVCYKCNGIARYSKLIDQSKNIDGNIIIGGSDKYVPACSTCM